MLILVTKLNLDGDVIRHKFTPSTVSGSSGETLFNFDTTKIIAYEPSVYVLDEIEINENLKMNIGLRFSAFSHVGPFKRYYKILQQALQILLRIGVLESILPVILV